MQKIYFLKRRQVGLFVFLLAFVFFINISNVNAATCSIIPSVCISSSSGVGSVNASDYWGNLFKTVGTNFFGSTCSGGTVVSGTYGNGTLVCSAVSGGSGSSYNATYATWAYNQTYSGSTFNSTYNTWSYNQTSFGSAQCSGTDQMYNLTILPNGTFTALCSAQGSGGAGSSYNETYATWLPNYTLFSPFWYNMTYSGSTFNSTYASFAYNHTSVANTTLVNAYGRWWYNHTTAANTTLVNAYGRWWYNMTYSGSTFNSTYNTWAYNQTTPAVNTLNNSYASLWYNYSNAKITPAQTSQTNLSNVAAINFTSTSGYITSNSTCIRIINGGTELAICS